MLNHNEVTVAESAASGMSGRYQMVADLSLGKIVTLLVGAAMVALFFARLRTSALEPSRPGRATD